MLKHLIYIATLKKKVLDTKTLFEQDALPEG